ncbi:MAG: hypothetical protein KJS95_04930 [Gammaproteobacteria bacterium]|nr:hypothetical protein [Gammaproteobacteria bacterium]
MNTLDKHKNLLFLAASVAVLAGCGSEEIASPGSGGNVTVNITTPPPPPPPPPPAVTLVTPAGGCPTIEDPAGLKDLGTITGPTGTYRNCELPARITRSTTLTRISGLLYSLGGRVDVGTDLGATPRTGEAAVTLTIQPGVVVFGSTGVSWLHVNRGNRINAAGTATSPIVFTSRDNVLGLNNDLSQGQWGGVVLSGRAPITDCTVAPNATPGTANCERQVEGAVDPAYYGGATPTDNSGTLRYVQIRYSGYVLSGNSELQALTTGGVGSGTTIQYVQSHNSSDDAVEFFGGTHDAKWLVFTGADDDNLDLDTGYRGRIQYVLAVQKDNNGDSMIELDSANALEDQTPRTFMRLANFTFVHRNSIANTAAMLLRGQADATLVNGVVTTPIACLRLNGTNIIGTNAAVDKVGPPVFRSVAMQCGATPFVGTGGLTADQVATAFGASVAANNNSSTFTSSLTGGFINGANETGRTATDPKTVDAWFDTTTYVGAVKDASDTWYTGWTCNSATANLGSANTACTALPRL